MVKIKTFIYLSKHISKGLNNNPLDDHIRSLFARPNGTREVMNYLREKWNLICSYNVKSIKRYEDIYFFSHFFIRCHHLGTILKQIRILN